MTQSTMDVPADTERIVVDYDGTDYAFEVVDADELAYAETNGEDAEAPDEVIEALETRDTSSHLRPSLSFEDRVRTVSKRGGSTVDSPPVFSRRLVICSYIS